MLQSAVRQDLSETFFRDFADLNPTDVETRFAALVEKAFSSLLGEGVNHDRISLIRRLDMRYQGQDHTLTVALPGDVSPAGNNQFATLPQRFEDTYSARHGHSNPEASLETVPSPASRGAWTRGSSPEAAIRELEDTLADWADVPSPPGSPSTATAKTPPDPANGAEATASSANTR